MSHKIDPSNNNLFDIKHVFQNSRFSKNYKDEQKEDIKLSEEFQKSRHNLKVNMAGEHLNAIMKIEHAAAEQIVPAMQVIEDTLEISEQGAELAASQAKTTENVSASNDFSAMTFKMFINSQEGDGDTLSRIRNFADTAKAYYENMSQDEVLKALTEKYFTKGCITMGNFADMLSEYQFSGKNGMELQESMDLTTFVRDHLYGTHFNSEKSVLASTDEIRSLTSTVLDWYRRSDAYFASQGSTFSKETLKKDFAKADRIFDILDKIDGRVSKKIGERSYEEIQNDFAVFTDLRIREQISVFGGILRPRGADGNPAEGFSDPIWSGLVNKYVQQGIKILDFESSQSQNPLVPTPGNNTILDWLLRSRRIDNQSLLLYGLKMEEEARIQKKF